MQETAYHGQQPSVQRLVSTIQTPPQEPQSEQQQEATSIQAFPPSFRALPLLSSDLPHTTINVSHSFVRPNDRGKEVLSFIVFVNPGNGKEGWKVEKMYPDLLYLDVLVRNSVGKSVAKKIANLPQGKLWVDHAPAKVDQRKAVLESYLQNLIQLPVKNNDEVIAFFTSNIVRDQKQSVMQAAYKEGYLTKRGKNFGGWKTRFFVLQGPVLEYYDRRGGTHLGSIVITGAQIGRQQSRNEGSPSGDEKEYRHAFLIIEAKKGPSGNHPRHVLCAGSDEERDSWVEVLVRYFTGVYIDGHLLNAASSLVTGNSFTTASQQPVPTGQPRSIMNSNDFSGLSIPRSSKPIPAGGVDPSPSLAPGSARPVPLNMGSDDYLRSFSSSRSVDPSPIGRQGPFAVGGMGTGVDAYKHGVENGDIDQGKSRSFWGFGKANGAKLQAAYPPRAVFGVALEEALDVAQICNLPAIVFRAIQYLEAKKADQEEGIYRFSGSSAVIMNLKDMFNSEGDVDLLASDEYWDPHAIAGLLRKFLRELPSSILTRELHLKFLGVIDFVDPQERIKELSQLISALPLANYSLLRALTAHLILIIQNSNVNKMTMRNVGIVFSPTLGIPAAVLSLMLGEFDRVFNVYADNDELGSQESEDAAENSPEILRRNSLQYSNADAETRILTASIEEAQSDSDDFINILDRMNGGSIPSGFNFLGKEAPSTESLTHVNDMGTGRETEFLDMEEEESEKEFEQDATTDNPMGDPLAHTYIIEQYVDNEDVSGGRTAPSSTQAGKQLVPALPESNDLLHPMDSSANPMIRVLTNPASPLDLSSSVARDITHPVHGGSYADIYSGVLSRDEKTTKVAIKVIRAHIYTEANQWKINKRLKREIRVWSCLQHPNIVPLLGTTQGFGPYAGMVCPWMSEGDLNHYLKDRKPSLSLKRRLQILSDIVEGLVYLHTRPIVHGDLSTGNILMEDGKAHLSDFGLSNLMAETRNGSLLTSTVGGAIRWAAPELYQIGTDPNAIPEVKKPCDVYSFGSVALEVISGKIPYYNITSDHQVLLKVMAGARPARPVEKLLTDAAWDMITACWTKDPHQRSSIEEVRRSLQTLRYECSTDLLDSMITS